MTQQMYLEFPPKPEHVDLLTSAIRVGFALTKSKWFCLSRRMISTAEDGSKCFHLCSAESAGDFAAFMETPERAAGSLFETS